jgi:hypothetical protein
MGEHQNPRGKSMRTIEAFDVRIWDGGEHHNHSFYLTSKEEADKYIAENKFDLVKPVTFVFFDTMAEASEFSREKLRERALSKLSEEEREALGFPRN